MEHPQLNWIANFIWGIADDVLRDLYVRGKYRDAGVILPMMVLRRLDSLLEPSTLAVLAMKTSLDKAKIIHQDQALRQAAGQAFYNTSRFTLRDLKARASQQQLKADFEAYLDGFSPNVQDILEKFEFRNQIPRLSKADALGTLIEKFLSPDVNLSPHPVLHGDGSIKHPGLDNHAMGTIFEELVRRFNEENNEEAGEHWTPRDAVTLMAKLVFVPVADGIDSGTYLVYDDWTRLSCHRFRANQVRLQLAVLAYNLGNLWRRLGLPRRIKSWSLTSLQQRLMKTGGRLVKHARYYWLLLAEGHLNRKLFGDMLHRIWALPLPSG